MAPLPMTLLDLEAYFSYFKHIPDPVSRKKACLLQYAY